MKPTKSEPDYDVPENTLVGYGSYDFTRENIKRPKKLAQIGFVRTPKKLIKKK